MQTPFFGCTYAALVHFHIQLGQNLEAISKPYNQIVRIAFFVLIFLCRKITLSVLLFHYYKHQVVRGSKHSNNRET
ncbi:hypothetical protein XELAEV_18024139mg [Xenopus laevis]|uniref:Uncharacterized protein n=1 Tax=Xenopus laevis TaxID=8355 RepID=A0A974HPV0_XENLA|nr:hypothetical protein XELAEV_18024139mg [Xenopus laevis]